MKGRSRLIEIAGHEPCLIIIPLVQAYLEWVMRHSQDTQIALAGYNSKIVNTYPAHKLFSFLHRNSFESFPIRSETPVQGLIVFTDASKNSRKATVIWKKDGEWQDHIIQGQEKDSLQTLELKAVVWVFSQWTEIPLNTVSDSLYIVGVVKGWNMQF